MTPSIGIRREDKHEWERRVPLTPAAVARLVAEGIRVVVQPSSTRVFDDATYAAAGARVEESLDDARVIFAVKEIPVNLFRPGCAYVFFSHTIKGQPHNMPMLKRMMELGCTLIDYERIVDERGNRLVFFGRHAGLAGMIDSLWVLGRRLAALGVETPFAELSLAHEHESLEAARERVAQVGDRIRSRGLPRSLAPFVCGFAGYGNVSRGAQEIYDLLPSEPIDPGELSAVTARESPPADRVFKVVFHEEHLVEPVEEGKAFVLRDYYDHPERYASIFDRHVVHLRLLINAIFWTESYPRLVTKDLVRSLLERGAPRLIVIGDISCDLGGSIECTVRATTPGRPAYVFRADGTVVDGFEGDGLAMMTTDCLPCELPREASEAFTDALLPFASAIARADFDADLERSGLPEEIRRATILWRGKLTAGYEPLAAAIR